MTFQGNHQSTGIPDLFNFICTRRLSGMLVVASREQDRSFLFRAGELVYALASEPGQLLGEILVRELGVSREIIEEVRRDPDTGFLGEELVRRGVIEREALNGVLERQIRVNLREVLRWEEWAFHFQKLDLPEREPELKLSTQLLIFDLTRELDEWQSIDEILPELDAILVRNPGSIRLEKPLKWSEDLPSLAEILADIDGQRSVRRLLQESPIPVRSHARALAELVSEDIIQVTKKETRPRSHDPRLFLLPVVPNLPARILSLVAAGNDDDFGAYRELVESDPVLCARVIRVGSLQRQDSGESFSLGELMGNMGLQTLKAILFAEAVRGLFLVPSSFTWHKSWERACTSSVACRILAELIDYPHPELAQTAGLLKDIGCILLAAENERSYQEVFDYVLETGVELLQAEEHVYRTNHCKVGARLAESWRFPRGLQSVIRDHHVPVEEHPGNALLNIVRLADLLVEPNNASSDGERLLHQLGLADDALSEARTRIEKCGYKLQTSGIFVPA